MVSSSRELQGKGNVFPWEYPGAPRGMIQHAPHEDLPEGAIAYLRNAHSYPREFQPRLASRIWSDIQPPALEGRTGYTLSQEGDVVTSNSGNIFLATDVSNFVVFPGSQFNWHEEIMEYLGPTQVRVSDSRTYDNENGCWLHGPLCINDWHKTEQRKVWQYGEKVYVSNDLEMTAFTEVLAVSRQTPTAFIGEYDDMDERSVIGNSNGILKIDYSTTPPMMWKMNTPVPAILIESDVRGEKDRFRYDYTYGMARLSGTGIRNREDTGVEILQQSGTCGLNVNTSPPQDYGIRWTEIKIGPGTVTSGRLQGAEMLAANQTPTYWLGLEGVTSGVFQLTVNSRTENFAIDFGQASYNVKSMVDVANAIEETIRIVFPFVTCEYDEDGYFVFTSGEEDGSSMGFGQNGIGAGYTEIASIMLIRAGDGGTLNNAYSYADPLIVGTMYVPRVPDEPTLPEQHWTHYVMWRTDDIGPDGVSPRVDVDTGEIKPPVKFTWVRDLRVNGAFLASRDDAGLVTATVGEFEKGDEGTPLVWEDGEVDTIYEYVSSTQVYTRTVTDADYYNDSKREMAACIGGVRVGRAQSAGGVLTNESDNLGATFTADDVRKTITWADGSYSVITGFTDANTVTLHDDITRPEQGYTLDPISRNFTDTLLDENLRSREGERHIGLLDHRFWVNMPNCNIIRAVPGFLLGVQSGDSFIHCSQLTNNKKYLAGYYLENRQKLDTVEDAITQILKAPNKFIVCAKGSIWSGPTNIPDIKKLPEFGEYYAVLHADIQEKSVGITDIGSIREVDSGVFEAVFTDYTVQQFTATGIVKGIRDLTVDPETGQDRVKRDLKESWQASASVYGKNLGHIIWRRIK